MDKSRTTKQCGDERLIKKKKKLRTGYDMLDLKKIVMNISAN